MTNYQTGVGLSSIGGLVSGIANLLAQNSVTSAVKGALRTQDKFAGQGTEAWRGGLPSQTAETAGRNIAEGSQHRQGVYEQAMSVQGPSRKGGAPGPDRRDQAAIQTKGENRANLSGYSDWQIQQMLARIKTQEQLNRIASTAQGQAGLVPYQINDAEHKYDWMSALGGATSTAGNLTSMWDFLKPTAAGVDPSLVEIGRQAPDWNPGQNTHLF